MMRRPSGTRHVAQEARDQSLGRRKIPSSRPSTCRGLPLTIISSCWGSPSSRSCPCPYASPATSAPCAVSLTPAPLVRLMRCATWCLWLGCFGGVHARDWGKGGQGNVMTVDFENQRLALD